MEEETGKNKRKKIIFIVVLFILAVICIFLINYFSSKYNLKEASSIGIIGGADGPTAIYIVGNQTWENILVYLSIVILIDIIICTIIKTIGNQRQKSFIKLNLLIIVCFNILAATLLFSSV